MKKNYTDINIVLDRSGSMASVADDTIGGFNRFLDDQKKAPGEATLTLLQFDDVAEYVYKALPLGSVEPLTKVTFIPRGSTALLDAIGQLILATGDRLKILPEDSRPEKVLIVVVTDGEENASRKLTGLQVADMIRQQRDIYKWEFIFMGSNQDAICAANKLNISAANTMTYASNAVGTQNAFGSLSSNMLRFRSGTKAAMDFEPEDYAAQAKAGAV